MLRVYMAGAYSADNVVSVLNNIKIGIRRGLEVLLAGYAPFVPWLDFLFQLLLRDSESLIVRDYYQYSMAWLEVSDAMLVLPNYETSKGTLAEIERAHELNIPVFYSMEDLNKHFIISL